MRSHRQEQHEQSKPCVACPVNRPICNSRKQRHMDQDIRIRITGTSVVPCTTYAALARLPIATGGMLPRLFFACMCLQNCSFKRTAPVASNSSVHRVPRVREGYWTDHADPFSVYICFRELDHEDKVCIGGPPRSCADGGRSGFAPIRGTAHPQSNAQQACVTPRSSNRVSESKMPSANEKSTCYPLLAVGPQHVCSRPTRLGNAPPNILIGVCFCLLRSHPAQQWIPSRR